MRIVLIGQAAFGAKVFEALMEKKEDVVAVYTPPDGPGGRIDPLKEAALAQQIAVVQPAGYTSDDVFYEYRHYEPELTIMAFVTDIIPPRFFEAPKNGAICYHPSILPRHRGASAINWAVMMGDTRTGLTIFWPDGGIDTGPILLQKEIDIGGGDTTGSLYFNHLFPMGIQALVEALDLIESGDAPRIAQDESLATYEPPCDDAVAAIDWSRSAREVDFLIRGCDPQPGAFVMFKGEKTRLYGARLLAESTQQAAGTILQVDDQGMQIALSGGILNVAKIKSGAGKKLAAGDFAAGQGLSPGDRLG